MSSDVTPIMISLGQFVLTILVLGGTGIWRLAAAESSIKQAVESGKEEVRKEMRTEITLIRERHNNTERWAMETFANKADFKETVGDLKSALLRIEDKIDKLRDGK